MNKEKVSHKIPKGLYRCEKCGEYRGEVMQKDLNWDGSFDKAEAEKSEEYLGVSCLCDGILCGECKKNKIHRPISNSYDVAENKIWHNPYFSGMMSCGECPKNKNEPPSEISSQNQQEEGEWEILAKLPQDADELAERYNKEAGGA